MAPLIVLVIVTLCARLAGQCGVAQLRHWAAAIRVGLAVMFCFTAVAHFNSMRPDMVRMVPAFVPNAEFMVTFTGICEVLGGIGLLARRTRRIAALALIDSSHRCAPRECQRRPFEYHAAGRNADTAHSKNRHFKCSLLRSSGGPVFAHPTSPHLRGPCSTCLHELPPSQG